MRDYKGEFQKRLEEPSGKKVEVDLDERREFLEKFMEKVNRENLAASFNLMPEEISDEELEEIKGFAENAGLEMFSATGVHYVFISEHDIFHAAEMMRLTKGYSATNPLFEGYNEEAVKTNHEYLLAELYPVLFLPRAFTEPLSVTIQDPVHLRAVMDGKENGFFQFDDIKVAGAGLVRRLERGEKVLPIEFELFYERIVFNVLRDNAVHELAENNKDNIEEWEEDFEEFWRNADRPDHYEEFAKRVFSGEWRENRRLFIDRFLQDIRSLS